MVAASTYCVLVQCILVMHYSTFVLVYILVMFAYPQGWEFAHRVSEQIARFWPKNEQMSDSLKKTSDSLVRSFLVSDLSNSLMIAHFL